MLSRRTLVAAGLAATASPAGALTPLPPEQMLYAHGLYLPEYLALKRKVAAGADRRVAHQFRQHAALVGAERDAVAGGTVTAVGVPVDLSTAVAEDAVQAIVEQAKGRRVVVLNEAHNVSGHRSFAAQVMRALRAEGFDLFLAETFTPVQAMPFPSIRDFGPGKPFLSMYGHYSRDPVFAELVREAAALGYAFADYEIRPGQQKVAANASPRDRIAEREEAEANNLIDVLRERPRARALVFCGYAHALEASDGTSEWFASRFKRKSGLDPLTVEQSSSWAYPGATLDPLQEAVMARFKASEPIVVQRNGAPVAFDPYRDRVDLAVFHPAHVDVEGRPGWLSRDPMRRAVRIPTPKVTGAALLQACHVAEGEAGVPADQFVVDPTRAEATFFLRPGEYVVRLETEAGLRVLGEVKTA